MRGVRSFVAIFIWIVDLALKFALGAALLGTAWSCVAYPFGFSFGTIWKIASALLGLAIVGFFDGDDLILNGIAKRIAHPPQSGRTIRGTQAAGPAFPEINVFFPPLGYR